MREKIILTIILVFFSCIYYVAASPRSKMTKYNNPFNIKRVDSKKYLGKNYKNSEKYEKFINVNFAVAAYLTLLDKNYLSKGYNTISKIVNRYAPPSENDTQKYINDLSSITKIAKNKIIKFDFDTAFSICSAMARLESSYILDKQTFRKGFIVYKFQKNL